MGEIHGGSAKEFRKHGVVFNIGTQWDFSKRYDLLASAGRNFRSGASGDPKLVLYLGLQICFLRAFVKSPSREQDRTRQQHNPVTDGAVSKGDIMKRIFIVVAILLVSVPFAKAQTGDWQGVEKVFGKKGIVQGDMFKITFPRTDLSVKIGDVAVDSGLALTSWIGFKGMGTQAMMMGDLVLLDKEVSPVIAKLVAEGLKVTALHNHLIGTTPVIMYLHFSGEGKPDKLARGMQSALSVTGTPLKALTPAASPATKIDWTKVETILGRTGQKKGNLLQVSFPRKEKIMENGMEVPPYMGMATGINIQMVGGKAATTGDFVLTADEVNPVVKALVDHGIAVTAIHSHMLFESPRLFFLHFWGYGEPDKLAAGLKAALDKTNSVK